MNGRIQDPHLGRFISADPFVQFPESTQGLNRYAYAANNPLSFTDPSGYFIGRLFKVFRNFFRKMLNIPIFRTIANIANVVLSGFCGPAAAACAAGGSALITGAAGGDFGDMFRAAAIAYVSAQAFQTIGREFGNPEFFTADHIGKTIAHGTVGGFSSVAGGGKFHHGFLAAGAGQLGAPAIDSLSSAGARIAAAAVVGGTASKLGGGKFANGAVTGAFGRLYSEEAAARARRDSAARIDAEGTPGPFRLSIGASDPRLNTVVTDGEGGLRIQIGTTNSPDSHPLLFDGIRVHEQQHIDDMLEYGTNLNILSGQPEGQVILVPLSEINVLERRGNRAELDFLRRQIPHPSQSADSEIRQRIRQVERYYVRFR